MDCSTAGPMAIAKIVLPGPNPSESPPTIPLPTLLMTSEAQPPPAPAEPSLPPPKEVTIPYLDSYLKSRIHPLDHQQALAITRIRRRGARCIDSCSKLLISAVRFRPPGYLRRSQSVRAAINPPSSSESFTTARRDGERSRCRY